MSNKLVLPGWDSLSPKKQELVKNWVESVLQAQAASKDLIELCNCDVANESAVTFNQSILNKKDKQENLEILESQDDSENLMKLTELPDNVIACIDKAACLFLCSFKDDQNEKDKCRSHCNDKPDC